MSARPLVRLLTVAALAAAAPALAAPPRPTVQLQTWLTLWDQDEDLQADGATYGDPEHDPGLSIQRARIGFEGEQDWLRYELRFGPSAPYDALDEAQPLVGVVDAFATGDLEAGPGRLRVTAGLDKVPYSREQLISSADLVFQERAVSTEWLAPGRELGVHADYELDMGLRARAGVANGFSDLFGDNNVGMLGFGRLEFSNGDAYRTRGVAGDPGVTFGAGAAARYEHDVATDTVGLEADAMARIGGLSVLVEVERDVIRPGDTTVDTPEVFAETVQQGLMAQVGWWQPLGDGGIEAAARFAVYDDAVGHENNGDVGVLHAGAVWRDLERGLDLGAGYVHREELGGQRRPNDTARVWVQVRWPGPRGSAAPATADEDPAPSEPEPAPTPRSPRDDWKGPYTGTWASQGSLPGAVVTLWRAPDGLLAGTFHMTEPVGRVEVNRVYPLASVDRTLEGYIRLRIDPHADGTDVVWFELAPQTQQSLCGWVYEDGRRQDTIDGKGGGAWVCWVPIEQIGAAAP